MIEILNRAIDCTCKLSFAVKLVELAEMSAILIILKRMLYIAGNSTVDIFTALFLVANEDFSL